MMAKEKKLVEIEVPEKVEAKLDDGIIFVKGPKGECGKKISNPLIGIEIKEGKVILTPKTSRKISKMIIGTLRAHIKNMFNGVKNGHVYNLKICSGHFPMNVSVNKNEFIIKNYFGEKIPRILKIKSGVKVNIEGDAVTVEGVDKELCGQVAADIERLASRKGYDMRVMQDGIYITNKGGKEIR